MYFSLTDWGSCLIGDGLLKQQTCSPEFIYPRIDREQVIHFRGFLKIYVHIRYDKNNFMILFEVIL